MMNDAALSGIELVAVPLTGRGMSRVVITHDNPPRRQANIAELIPTLLA
jgi:hypothetical protein